MEGLIVVPFALLLALVFRLIAGSMDGDRVENHARENGWTILERHWRPFGPGWYGSKSDRLYEIKYRNREGEVRSAFVKTSALAGVYVSHDRLVEPAPEAAASAPPGPAPVPSEAERLRQENEELKARIAELEKGSDRA